MIPVTLPGGVNPYLDAEIRKMATALLRESWDANIAALHGADLVQWDECTPVVRDEVIAVQDVLLRDLSRPASRDAMARWLAAHHGLMVGATAPRWTHSARRGTWSLWGVGPEYVYESALTDPAEALRAACLAAVGRTA